MKHFIIMKKLIPIIAVFFFFSCRKDIITVDKDYEGNWYGTLDTTVNTPMAVHSNLKIDSQNNLSYQGYNSSGETTFEFNGTAKIRGNVIHVKGIPSHRFTIISQPTQINASKYHWSMTLKGPDGSMSYYK